MHPVLRSNSLHILHPADEFTDADDIDDPDNLHNRNHDQLMAKKEKQGRELAKQHRDALRSEKSRKELAIKMLRAEQKHGIRVTTTHPPYIGRNFLT